MARVLLGLVVLALGAAVASPTASAASLSLEYQRTEPGQSGDRHAQAVPPRDVYRVRVDDGEAQANRLVLDAFGRVRDDGVVLLAGPGCAVGPDGWASCSVTPRVGTTVGYELAVDSGGGDDRVSVDGQPRGWSALLARLGAGNDVLSSAEAAVTAFGEAGDDQLAAPGREPPPRPGPGYPRVSWDGGGGADRVAGSAAIVSYAGRSAGVRVTPDGIADDGTPGERDDVAPDVGAILGGDGADELVSSGWHVDGGPGADRITGADEERPSDPVPSRGEELLGAAGDDLILVGAGHDTLSGGEGDDLILAGAGHDTLSGGEGDDRLDGGPGADRISDGPGADLVDGGDGDDAASTASDAAADAWLGGEGFDAWESRTPGLDVLVTLNGVADDGAAGEGDLVGAGWERVMARRGRLVGTDGPEQLVLGEGGSLDGAGGDDLLVGGDEVVVPGPGRDVVLWPGVATVDARDGEADRVTCGPTVSLRLLLRDRGDRIEGCYAVGVAGGRELRRGERGRSSIVVGVRCMGRQPCRGQVALERRAAPLRPPPPRRPAPVLVAQAYVLPPGGARRIVLDLGPRATLMVRCRRAAVVVVTTSPFRRGAAWREELLGPLERGPRPRACGT